MEPEELTLDLPLPPTMNQMVALAKQRTRKPWKGGWLKRAAPIVYDNAMHEYQLNCSVELRMAGIQAPREPWKRWALLSAHFRTHSTRDWTELAAGLKWVIDMLVSQGFLLGDSPREMERPKEWPTQEINRKDMGVRLTIKRIA